MSNKQERKQIYRECRARTALSDTEWARLMSVGAPGGEREVHKKERPEGMTSSRGVSMPEALAAQLLLFLHEEGYCLSTVSFDEDGRMTQGPKRAQKSR